jgi:hypothetical protein
VTGDPVVTNVSPAATFVSPPVNTSMQRAAVRGLARIPGHTSSVAFRTLKKFLPRGIEPAYMVAGKRYTLFLQSQHAYASGDTLLRQATQHPGKPFLHFFALNSGRRTIYRALSRRPRLVDATQLPETLRLDHAQETFNLTIDNQRWLQYLEAGGRLSHLCMVLGKKVTRHCDRCARIITALTLFELKCLPELIERIGVSPKSSQNARKLLMISTSLVMLGIGIGNGLFVTFGRIRQLLHPHRARASLARCAARTTSMTSPFVGLTCFRNCATGETS